MIKRKSHNLDEALLGRAKQVLGAKTETDTIHEALRAVVIGERIVSDLRAARGPGLHAGAGVLIGVVATARAQSHDPNRYRP